MINCKMVRHGSVATAWWFLADEEPPRQALAKHFPGCDDPGIYDQSSTSWHPGFAIDTPSPMMAGMDIKVDAVQLESGTYVQRIRVGERWMLVPPLRDPGQADRLSAELKGLQRLVDSPRKVDGW